MSNDFDELTLDVETAPNFFMASWRNRATGERWIFSTEPGIGRPLAEMVEWFRHYKNKALILTFNGNFYDNPMIAAVIKRGIIEPAALYQISCDLIDHPSWHNRIESVDGEVGCDVFAVIGGQKARVGGLKEAGIKLGYRYLRTLPYAPDQMLTHDQKLNTVDYNEHDHNITDLVADCLADEVKARIALSVEYDTRVINQHNAGLAEKVLAAKLFGHGKPMYPTQTVWQVTGQELGEKGSAISARNATTSWIAFDGGI